MSKVDDSASLVLDKLRFGFKAADSILLTISGLFDSAGMIDGTLSIRDSLLSKELSQASISGKAELNYDNLESFRAVLPTGLDLGGKLALIAGINGTLTKPDINLNSSLQQGHLKFAEEGIALTDLKLDVSSVTVNKFKLMGSSVSGEGTINLAGNIDTQIINKPRLEIALTAENALFIDTPTIKAEGNADITVSLQENTLDIAGQVDIGRADINVGTSMSCLLYTSPSPRD